MREGMISVVDGTVRGDIDQFLSLAARGLSAMYLAESQEFVHTVRGCRGPDGPHLVGEGRSLRYAAIVALGLHHSTVSVQRDVLAGTTAEDLSRTVAHRAVTSTDPGAAALAAWSAAEVENRCDNALFERLRGFLHCGQALATVDVAWTLTAAVSAGFLGNTADIASQAAHLLLAHQGVGGLFPHALPPTSLGRARSHVGCFADQVYPIQALARFAATNAEAEAMAAANRCAATICDLQGTAGEWWWHYDARGASVVEGYPVYSVHQHAMAPMALIDLFDAGGDDHRESVELGVRWLSTHPQVLGELVDRRFGVVWRKVGRREPPKGVRKLNAATTAVRPGLKLPGLDRLCPTSVIDHECRPYELGWLLYAWQRSNTSTPERQAEEAQHG
jgi:hypothetical protein